MLRLTIIVLLCASISTQSAKFEYVVDTIDDGMIMDSSPMGFLERSNKTLGAGYVLGINDLNNIYVDDSSRLRATTADKYFYFYKDNSKYYIRDEKCNLICLDPCGEAYPSAYRLQHYCKFKVEKATGIRVKIYIVSSGPILNYRALEFVQADNIVRGRVNIKSLEDVPASFKLKGPLKLQNKCPNISKVRQFNLDAKPEGSIENTRCSRLNLKAISQNRVLATLPIKQQSMLFYNLKIEEKYVNGKGKLEDSPSEATVFLKQFIKPSVYTFVNSQTCNYLCLNKCGSVYMSPEMNKDCNVALEQADDRNEHYIRFNNNNYYITYNDTTGAPGFSRGGKSKVVLVETTDTKFTCRVNVNSTGPPDDKCAHNLGNKLIVSLPPLFIFLLLNYNNKTMILGDQ